MSARVYVYAGCSTCRKALKWLKDQGIAASSRDLVRDPPPEATLRSLWERSGAPLRNLFNTSGQSYRDGGFKDRLATLTEAEALAALAADGKLVKRPLLDLGERVLIGFDEGAWAAALSEV